MHSSTPDNTKKSAKKSNTGSTLRIVNVNFQSIKTKQGQLYNMLDSIKPDIICGTETWIDNSIKVKFSLQDTTYTEMTEILMVEVYYLLYETIWSAPQCQNYKQTVKLYGAS